MNAARTGERVPGNTSGGYLEWLCPMASLPIWGRPASGASKKWARRRARSARALPLRWEPLQSNPPGIGSRTLFGWHIGSSSGQVIEETMAGPGSKGGRPAQGHEQVEQMHLEATVLNLRDKNFTYRAIARKTGLHFTTVGEMLRRINNRTLADCDRRDVRAQKLRQYARIEQQLWPLVVNEGGHEGFVPDLKALAELRHVMKAVRELMGADAPTAYRAWRDG